MAPTPSAEAAPVSLPRSWRRRVLSVGKVVFALAALAFVLSRVPLHNQGGQPGILTVLGGARGELLALGAVAYAGGIVCWAARWRTLLALGHVDVPLRLSARWTLEAQAGGVILPGGVAGDALRVACVVERGAPVILTVASVLLDRVVGLATLTGLAALLYAGGTGRLDATTLFLLGGPLGLVLVLTVARSQALRHAAVFARRPLSRVAEPLFAYVGAPGALRAVARACLLSLGVSAVQLGVVRLILHSLGASHMDEGLVAAGTALSFCVAAVPALPGGWGTSDAAFVLLMGRAGVAPAQALGAWLVYRIFWYAAAVVGALLVLGRAPASPPASPP